MSKIILYELTEGYNFMLVEMQYAEPKSITQAYLCRISRELELATKYATYAWFKVLSTELPEFNSYNFKRYKTCIISQPSIFISNGSKNCLLRIFFFKYCIFLSHYFFQKKKKVYSKFCSFMWQL